MPQGLGIRESTLVGRLAITTSAGAVPAMMKNDLSHITQQEILSWCSTMSNCDWQIIKLVDEYIEM